MPRRFRVILVLHGDPALRDTVAASASPGSLVTSVNEWPALEAALLAAPPSVVAVVDPYAGGAPPGPSLELRDLLRRLPFASVVPALTVTPEHAHDVTQLDEWGVSGVISTGHDDTPEAIRHRISEACVRPLKRLLANILGPGAPPQAYGLLSAAADTTCDGGNVSDFAEGLKTSPSTLLRWCQEAGLPNPRTLLQWISILLAANLLAESPRSVENVARACGYASPAELRRVMLRLTGFTPAQLRSNEDGIEHVSDRFLRAIEPPPT